MGIYINPYYWVDDHPLLYGNNGSLDPGTYFLLKKSQRKIRNSHRHKMTVSRIYLLTYCWKKSQTTTWDVAKTRGK